MASRIRTAISLAGPSGVAFVAFAVTWAAASWAAPRGFLVIAAEAGTILTGLWIALRWFRIAARQAIWRLRNRLLVTYLFIAVAPIAMVVLLALLGGYSLVHQLAAYLVTSELERRTVLLNTAAESVVRLAPGARAAEMPQALAVFDERFPGLEALLRQYGQRYRYPEGSALPDTPAGWETSGAVLRRAGRYYLWNHRVLPAGGELTLMVPLTRQFLAGLVPDLGRVDIGDSVEALQSAAGLRGTLPAPVNRFDIEVVWFATGPAADWDMPGVTRESLIAVRTRVSAVLGAVFNNNADQAQGALEILIVLGFAIFVVVEIICGVIGISMTRTITAAVHRLYEGTQKVMQGDFSHRIEVPAKGDDQLAELSRSFNQMTAHVERLLVVAKEKERLESEIEIARRVQSQLFPRDTPASRGLRLTAVCEPARMVSGDYYDYAAAGPGRIALALGDVAGKGISGALLMAALQSSLRAQLQASLESVSVPINVSAGAGSVVTASAVEAPSAISTAHLVERINRQLFEATPPEKYASLFLGIYDESTSELTYTNAGHLPPLLIRDGIPRELEVNGTVVGAFPGVQYGESRVRLDPGDLLVCFTDGATEPENAFGEMFGEQRLTEVIVSNANLPEDRIIAAALASVREWIGSAELPDDFTVLLARRV